MTHFLLAAATAEPEGQLVAVGPFAIIAILLGLVLALTLVVVLVVRRRKAPRQIETTPPEPPKEIENPISLKQNK